MTLTNKFKSQYFRILTPQFTNELSLVEAVATLVANTQNGIVESAKQYRTNATYHKTIYKSYMNGHEDLTTNIPTAHVQFIRMDF